MTAAPRPYVIQSGDTLLTIALVNEVEPSVIWDDPKNAEVIALVSKFLIIAAAFMLFDATQVSCAQALRGLKDVRIPMVVTGIAYWAVGFPTAAYLGLKTEMGAVGVWWGLLLSLFTAAALLGARLFRLTR